MLHIQRVALIYMSSTRLFRSKDHLFVLTPSLFPIVPVPKTPLFMKQRTGN